MLGIPFWLIQYFIFLFSFKAQAIKSQVNNIKTRSSNLDFQYQDPERNFDRRKVKGVLANLIKPRDSKYNTALDTAIGGKVMKH